MVARWRVLVQRAGYGRLVTLSPETAAMLTAHDLLDRLLHTYRKPLADELSGYANHCRRMLSFCLALAPQAGIEDQHKLAIAAAFHDIGLWTDDTLDYLPPSVQLAADYLSASGHAGWIEEVGLMISEHHRLRPVRDARYPLVEVFRRADLVDFSRGVYTAGLPRSMIRAQQALFPNAGFHRMLARRGLRWMARHPLRPLPMLKW